MKGQLLIVSSFLYAFEPQFCNLKAAWEQAIEIDIWTTNINTLYIWNLNRMLKVYCGMRLDSLTGTENRWSGQNAINNLYLQRTVKEGWQKRFGVPELFYRAWLSFKSNAAKVLQRLNQSAPFHPHQDVVNLFVWHSPIPDTIVLHSGGRCSAFLT